MKAIEFLIINWEDKCFDEDSFDFDPMEQLTDDQFREVAQMYGYVFDNNTEAFAKFVNTHRGLDSEVNLRIIIYS